MDVWGLATVFLTLKLDQPLGEVTLIHSVSKVKRVKDQKIANNILWNNIYTSYF